MSLGAEDVKPKAFHAEEGTRESIAVDPVAEKKLVRKIDLYLMPSVFILYLFSYVDRSNIGLAKVAGMEEDLELTSYQYYTAVIVWVIGYTIAAVPSNMILSRMRPSVFIPIITFGWGAMAALIGVARHQSQLIALRFLLGVFEAGFSPAVIFLISTWYRKSEQYATFPFQTSEHHHRTLTPTRSKRFIIFLTAGILSGAFGSVVSGAITSTLDGTLGVRGWRWLFIVEGTATAGISLIVHWTLLDYPHSGRGLTLQEQDLVQQRLIQDGMADPTGPSSPSENRASLLTSFLQAVCSWRTWLLVPAYMTILGALAISYFYPTLINGMGYTATNAQYMMAPLYLVSLVVAIPVCFLADRKPHLRGVFLVLNLGTGGVFFALTAGIQNYTARYVFLCLINMTIWTGNALGLSFATTALASVTGDVRAIMLALMNGIAALAQLYGSALFPEDDAPGYLVGFAVFAATFAVGAVFYGVADVLFKRYPYKG